MWQYNCYVLDTEIIYNYINGLVKKLNDINFETNKVNIKDLKEIIKYKADIKWLINLISEDSQKILGLETKAIVNMPHYFLVWKSEQNNQTNNNVVYPNIL